MLQLFLRKLGAGLRVEHSRMVLVTQADFANLSLLPQTAELRRLLERATVVASDAMPRHVVTMNTQVVVHDEARGKRRTLRIVFPDGAEKYLTENFWTMAE